MVCFYLLSLDKVGDIYMNKSRETIYEIKKDFLKDTINNLFSEIDIRREQKNKYVDRLLNRTSEMVKLKQELNDVDFNQFIIRFFTDNPDYEAITVLLWDKRNETDIFDPQGIVKTTWKETLTSVSEDFSCYLILERENETLFLGVSKNYVEERVKEEIADIIRTTQFDGGTYIWVNEILDYTGGDNYAIRRIHPNLPETEGTYLSTNMTDIMGNYPYLKELQGINEEGEVYFTYYFKELNSTQISQKLTYAKLYKDYNWIIAMGIYMEDIQPYFDQIEDESSALVSRLTVILVILFIGILTLSLFTMSFIEKIYYRHSKRLMELEINQDSLTKADSRRRGAKDLEMEFEEFKRIGMSPCIVICDIDKFKEINDTYGHNVGDIILSEFVNELKLMLKGYDKIIRWGGDEFILILYGIKKENAIEFGSKILKKISSLEITSLQNKLQFTVSMGLSYFNHEDADYNDTIKRADEALYISKTKGRNQINMII